MSFRMMVEVPSHVSSRGHEYGVKHFKASFDGALVDVVRETLQLSSETTEELLWLGSVYLREERHTDPQAMVKAGDQMRVHTKPRRFPTEVIRYPELIVFENENFVVINKPSGVPVHATVDNLHENLIAVLSKKMNVQLKVTHRLDIATRGLMLFAKTDDFQREFNEYLVRSQVQKQYRATVQGREIRTGTWVHYMNPSPRAPKIISRDEQPGWKKCVLHVLKTKSIGDKRSEVHIELETGRSHQIRAQFSHEGHPLVGDKMYGSSQALAGFEAFQLESFNLSFPGPVAKFDFSLI